MSCSEIWGGVVDLVTCFPSGEKLPVASWCAGPVSQGTVLCWQHPSWGAVSQLSDPLRGQQKPTLCPCVSWVRVQGKGCLGRTSFEKSSLLPKE